jgi:hypothetical protein
MSTYTWVEAKLNFETPQQLEAAIAPLRTVGYIQTDDTMRIDDCDVLAGDGQKVISDDGLTFTLPSEMYLNIGRYIYDVIDASKSGYFHTSDSDEETFYILNNGRELEATSMEEVVKFLESPMEIDLDSLLLSEEEFEQKHNNTNYDYYELRSDTFSEAFYNALECFQYESTAMRFIKDKMLVKVIHHESRAQY